MACVSPVSDLTSFEGGLGQGVLSNAPEPKELQSKLNCFRSKWFVQGGCGCWCFVLLARALPQLFACRLLAGTVSDMSGKSVASRAGSSSARRPNVGDQLIRSVDTCEAAARLLQDGAVVSAADAIRSVSEHLLRVTDGSLEDVVPNALSKFVSSLPSVRQNLTLHRYVSKGDFAAELKDVFLGSPGHSGCELQSLVTDLSAGEHGSLVASLFDALVTFESHKHINLVWHQAHRYAPRMRRDPEDLFGWGWHGLKVSLTRYDPTRNAFSTYACACIVSKIRDGVRAEMPVVKKMLTLRNKVSSAEAELVAEMGRAPTMQEIADAIGEDLERLKLLQVQLAIADSSSLDELTSFEDDREFTPGWLADEAELPEDAAVESDRRDRVRSAIGRLAPEDGRLVEMLVVDQLPLRVVAERLSLTQRQLRAQRERVFALLADELADLADVRA